jgi:pyruvate dehydrogenase E2 component (dihydrolipoamide acetyltransferase)
MAFEITIPRLGWSMEEGTFVRWLKQDGEAISSGEALFELEGEKAAQDIEAVDSGILRITPQSPQPGTVVQVGAVIGYLVQSGEDIPGIAVKEAAPAAVVTPPTVVSADTAAPVAAPSVRRRARELGVNLANVAGSGPAGRITSADLTVRPAVSTAASSVIASPRARRVAKELGIDWQRVSGTGTNGRVREQDIRAAVTAGHSNGSEAGHRAGNSLAGQQIPVSRHRRTVADRMMASVRGTAPVTLTTRIDATNLVSLRQQFKSSGTTPVPSYSDIVIKLAGLALKDHELLMAQWTGDQLVIPDAISIGMAVDTDAGLIVPVIRDVPSLSLIDVAAVSSELVARARAGQLKAPELQGGVFTVTNLGSFGIDAFTPILNSPESAILGLGRIRREPAIVENQVVPRDQMTLSLTFDHRVVDGAPASRFLQAISQALESPSAWLLSDNRCS